MNEQCQVCIIDDDQAIREALRLLLFADGLACCDYESADAFLEDRNCGPIHCMLLDVRMPGTDGLELFRMLNHQSLTFPVIFITGHGDIPLAVSAIKQGAYDFLTKPFKEGELLRKVHGALDHYHSARERLHELQDVRQRVESCTPRERDVMQLLAEGLANKRIAKSLNISPRTVEIHRAHVMEKMEADSLPALVRMIALLENEDGS